MEKLSGKQLKEIEESLDSVVEIIRQKLLESGLMSIKDLKKYLRDEKGIFAIGDVIVTDDVIKQVLSEGIDSGLLMRDGEKYMILADGRKKSKKTEESLGCMVETIIQKLHDSGLMWIKDLQKYLYERNIDVSKDVIKQVLDVGIDKGRMIRQDGKYMMSVDAVKKSKKIKERLGCMVETIIQKLHESGPMFIDDLQKYLRDERSIDVSKDAIKQVLEIGIDRGLVIREGGKYMMSADAHFRYRF